MDSVLLHLPPLDPLRGFLAAARHLSFTQAAAELCLSQSAISRQVHSLERALGTPLFVRGVRSLSLTEAGTRLMLGTMKGQNTQTTLSHALKPIRRTTKSNVTRLTRRGPKRK